MFDIFLFVFNTLSKFGKKFENFVRGAGKESFAVEDKSGVKIRVGGPLIFSRLRLNHEKSLARVNWQWRQKTQIPAYTY